jgi:hypothetical protein
VSSQVQLCNPEEEEALLGVVLLRWPHDDGEFASHDIEIDPLKRGDHSLAVFEVAALEALA